MINTPYFKRPLNLIDNPIYPDIKKSQPKQKSTGKFWQVDESILLDRLTEDTTTYQEALLTQGRQYGNYKYAQSSFPKKLVDDYIRIPLTDPRESFHALHRMPETLIRTQFSTGYSTGYIPGGGVMINKPLTTLQVDGTIDKTTKERYVDKSVGNSIDYTYELNNGVKNNKFLDASMNKTFVKRDVENVNGKYSLYKPLNASILYNPDMLKLRVLSPVTKKLKNGVLLKNYYE